MRVLGIDPGNEQTAVAVIGDDYTVVERFKRPNGDVLAWLLAEQQADQVGIEMIASYGMPVGREVFETCVWIGRYIQVLRTPFVPTTFVYRRQVKLNLCGSAKAKDVNVRQALVDRFAPGQPNHGKGTKQQPGHFYGFAADMWAAYAVAVTHLDILTARDTRADVCPF